LATAEQGRICRRASLPGSFPLQERAELIRWRRRTVQDCGEPVEVVLTQLEKGLTNVDVLRRATGSLKHKLGATLAKRVGRLVDEVALLAAGSDVDGLIACGCVVCGVCHDAVPSVVVHLC
jgi:hypothetical protein